MKTAVTRVMPFFALLTLLSHPQVAFAQERIEGKVVGTKLTHCDMNVKIGGCAGTLTMERKADGKSEEINVDVPLGTPITRGSETMYLPALRGKTAVVTHIMEKNARVAKSIEVK